MYSLGSVLSLKSATGYSTAGHTYRLLAEAPSNVRRRLHASRASGGAVHCTCVCPTSWEAPSRRRGAHGCDRMIRVVLIALAMEPAPAFASQRLDSLSSVSTVVAEEARHANVVELEISHLSASKLHAKMHVDGIDLSVITTNAS
jgi:hypothetical protein